MKQIYSFRRIILSAFAVIFGTFSVFNTPPPVFLQGIISGRLLWGVLFINIIVFLARIGRPDPRKTPADRLLKFDIGDED